MEGNDKGKISDAGRKATGMKPSIVILGVGRSGTTALYSALQNVLYGCFDGLVKSIYEPFLWEWTVFNKRLNAITDEFTYMSSVSYQGIAKHHQLPMLISEEMVAQYKTDEFLCELFKLDSGCQALIAKLIRANGRYHLLRSILPDAIWITMMRNPLDVVNSSAAMFSFYGEDFHASDYERFCLEVEQWYGPASLNLPRVTVIQKHAFYWYFMSRVLLEESIGDNRVFPLLYEQYRLDQTEFINDIVNKLGIKMTSMLMTAPQKKVGPSYSSVNLTKDEILGLQVYMELYQELLNTYFPDTANIVNCEKIMDRYLKNYRKQKSIDRFYGRTPLYIKNNLSPRSLTVSSRCGILNCFRYIPSKLWQIKKFLKNVKSLV